MSDAAEWKGRRLGPYEVGERYLELPEDEGRLHEAHHVETGEPALVVMPGTGDDWWPASTSWTVKVTSFTEPKALVLHPKRSAGETPPTFHELALGFIRMAGTLAPLDEQTAVRAHALGESRQVYSRPGTKRWGLIAVGLALLAAGFVLIFCQHLSMFPWTRKTAESISFSDRQAPTSPTLIAYAMPEKPFKEQAKPPCIPDVETEIRGGCWNELSRVAPCPQSSAEYQGKCYVPVRKPEPQQNSIRN